LVAAILAVGCAGKSNGADGDGGAGKGGSSGTGGNGTGGAGGKGAGGAGGKGAGGAGAGGTGGTTTNYFVGQVRDSRRTKLDLLVMVDNSSSMGGKQRFLTEAMPVLISRLVSPPCVDELGNVGGQAPCPAGSSPEFPAVEDLHLGVLTSSIGDHGSGDLCSAVTATPENTFNDRAQLVPSVRTGVASWNNSGFLTWDPRAGTPGTTPHQPPGYGSPLAGSPGTLLDMVAAFESHVEAAGERGCGHEAQLESWYRFLVDPEPVGDLTNDMQVSVRGQVNQLVLAQRAQFLRPDSVLALILLTDENDCSFLDEDGTQGWLAMFKGGPSVNNWHMPRGTSACVDPNDPECRPCAAGDADSACANGTSLTQAEDNPNLRCYRMKERFGIDLKYPVSRYVEALTSPTIDPRMTGDRLPNPIFASPNDQPPRTPSDVVVLGILGVPWQDLATDGSAPGTPDSLDPSERDLKFMTAEELEANGRWDAILGDGSEPLDPFMIESIDPRPSGSPHPFLPGVAITPPGGAPNAVNGTEQAVPPADRFDLQFACTFLLPDPVPCTTANDQGCDCNATDFAQMSPLCSYPVPMMDGTQVRGKAYPSIRELEVLRELGSSAVVASVCPKNTEAMASPQLDPSYGYNPAMTALVERLKPSFVPSCLPRPLEPTDGRVGCAMVEARPPTNGLCEICNPAIGRSELEESTGIQGAVAENMRALRLCGDPTPCEDFCYCELAQLDGADLTACQTETTVSSDLYGFCYVDPENGAGSEALVAQCPETQRRILRFLGDNLPARDSATFAVCGGAIAP
jgi:hypothetical protein